jgi:hypothetical protein
MEAATMSAEDNQTIVRRFWQGVNEGDLGRVGELLSPDLEVDHPYITEDQRGPEIMSAIIGLFRAICPDFEFVIQDEIAVGEMVVNRWTANGIAAPEMMAPGPGGGEVTVSGISIFAVSGGQILRISLRFESHEDYPLVPKEEAARERLRTDPVLKPLGEDRAIRWKCKIRPWSCMPAAPTPEAE